MNWVRQSTRLAIYLRDGMACAYCGGGVEDGVRLELDHVRPASKGGGNEPANLITACQRCNGSRGTRPVAEFARAVAEYLDHDVRADEITRHISACRRRVLPREEARELLSRRGSVARVLHNDGA
jgi:hypothetical protein